MFTSERGAPFSTAGFARMIQRAGSEAKLGFKAHPHMLRHACGHTLANEGARHQSPAGLSRPPQHPAHGALHGIVANTFSGFLARVKSVP